MILKLEEAVRATGATMIKPGPVVGVGCISVDSRKLAPGALFVALRGPRFDGHDFLSQAAEAGASAMIVDEASRINQLDQHQVSVLLVEDSLRALGDLAGYLRQREAPKVVAVTGSNGKTTTKEMIAEILSAAGSSADVLKNSGNENNLVGVPLTLFKLAGQKVAVLEMGTNAPGEISRLAEIADPDVGVITNVGPAHLEGLGSIDGVARAKGEMLARMRPGTRAVLNAEDDRVKALGRGFEGEVTTFGRGGEVCASAVEEVGLSQTRVTVDLGGEAVAVTLNYLGLHNVSNALAAAAAASALGASPEAIKQGLEAVRPVPMRMQILLLPGGAGLISDCYNANPASVAAALETLKKMKARRRIAVLGDMCELGRQSGSFHYEIGLVAGKSRLWRLYLLGDYAPETARGGRDGGLEESGIKLVRIHGEIVGEIAAEMGEGDWILVKGSRSQRMENLVELLTGGKN